MSDSVSEFQIHHSRLGTCHRCYLFLFFAAQRFASYTLIGPFSTNTILNVIPAGQDSPVFIKPNDTSDLGMEQVLVQRVLSTDSVDVTEYGLVALQKSDD